MVKSKPYKAYVNELGEVIIDFDGDNSAILIPTR